MKYTYTLPSETGYNVTQGLDKYFGWIVYEQPSFINYFLLMIWAVIFMGGTFSEKKLTSDENYIKWGFLASFVTFGIAIIATLMSDMQAAHALIISGVATVLCGIIWFSGNKVFKP